jgi:peptide/nickel transport system permease protein
MLSSPEILRLGTGGCTQGRAHRTASQVGVAEKVAGVALIVLVLVAIVSPLLSPYSPIVPSGAPYLPPGSSGHPFGTDNIGLDLATRIAWGLRTSLFAAVIVTAVSALCGLGIGLLAGAVGGWLDNALMRITDLFLAFPAVIVAMAITAALGPGLVSSMIGISLVWWPLYARLVRGEAARTARSLHVEAARVAGTRGIRLLVRHVAPPVLPTVLVTASLDIGAVVMTLAALSFLGLGAPAPAPELGSMAAAGLPFILTAWWIPVLPGIAVGVIALVFNYAGDGMRSFLRAKGV